MLTCYSKNKPNLLRDCSTQRPAASFLPHSRTKVTTSTYCRAAASLVGLEVEACISVERIKARRLQRYGLVMPELKNSCQGSLLAGALRIILRNLSYYRRRSSGACAYPGAPQKVDAAQTHHFPNQLLPEKSGLVHFTSGAGIMRQRHLSI